MGRLRRVRWLQAALAALLALGWLAATPPTPARAAIIPVTNTNDSGPGSLRAAIAAAEANADLDTIQITATGTIHLLSGLGTLTRPVTIAGPGRDALAIQGDDTFSLLWFNAPGGPITVGGVTFEHGKAPNGNFGGCLWVAGGSVALQDARVRDCAATAGGGGVLQTGGSLLIERTELLRNTAGFDPVYGGGGGAIFVDQYSGNTTLTIRDSVIAGNRAIGDSDGGGVKTYLDASRPGGANAPYTLNVFVERSTVGGTALADANTGYSGGGLAIQGGFVSLTESTISGNAATAFGGGLRVDGGAAYVTDSTVSGNLATYGGGFHIRIGTATLTNATVVGNRADFNGGGLLCTLTCTATLENTTLSGNGAGGNGGGLYLGNGAAFLYAVTVVGNAADDESDGHGNGTSGDGSGGGLFRLNGTFDVEGSLVAGNRKGASTPDDCVGSPTLSTYNIWGAGCPVGGTNIVYVGPLAALVDPVLRDNGGTSTPHTRTHALAPGSLARDRIPCLRNRDQRGVSRAQPVGGQCDVGALEARALALTLTTAGGGHVRLVPPGVTTAGGTFPQAEWEVVTLTPQPSPGQTFVGWVVDGTPKGWAPPLTLTMNASHSVQAAFAPTVTFADTPSGRADHAAIVALASRGYIFGYNASAYGPEDGVQRAQMAALIARATPKSVADGAANLLAPPACTAAGTWDCEVWPNTFTDRGTLVEALWRDVAVLQHYGVASGYAAGDCAARGKAAPCFGPNDPVTYAETITFITRAMVAKGYWVNQPTAPQPYAGVPGVFAGTVATYHYYTAGAGGVPAPPADWNAGATRGWFARALWQALNSYWGYDGTMPDGRPAGGHAP